MLRHLDLFSGLGGFSLGLEATGGFETVAFCDIEKFSRKVLKKHWPTVKQYKDIKELTYEQIKEDTLAPIDIITGGYPCQPFSVAGSQLGEKDKRHLWPDMFRIIKECKPTWVIGENVGGHIKLGLDTVLQDLESEGYSVRAFSISASSIGANHQREESGSLPIQMWRTPDNMAGGSNLPGIQKALDQGHLKRPSGQPIQIRLMDQVREPRLWEKVPTPTARDYKDSGPNSNYEKMKQKGRLAGSAGGSLNPTWVEWLMGYPKGWTDLKD